MKKISPHALYEKINQSEPCELIDVRTPEEFTQAHILGAELCPVQGFDAKELLRRRKSPTTPLYVICEHGPRAAWAVMQLEKAGGTEVVLLEGGMDAWAKAGLPVQADA